MTMPSSGPLNMGGTTTPVSVAQELGLGLTTTISMDQAAVRTLAGVGGSGTTWSMNSLYGKANRVALSHTFSASTANASLNVTTISGYVAGKSDITITVNSGVYLYATSTATPGLTLVGGAAGDTVTLVNNGLIMGQGGNGASGSTAGLAGGIAISLGFNTTINNTNAAAYIGGGGGGGGGYQQTRKSTTRLGGGGGGAGGGNGGAGTSGAGGTGGAIGATGANGIGGKNTVAGGGGSGGGGSCAAATISISYGFSGGGGGRIFPGTGGAGGFSDATIALGTQRGGAGGSTNAVGQNFVGTGGCGGGGGWGASGGSGEGGAGGAGGRAVSLNGRTVTWTSGNTTRVYGSVS